MSGDINNPVNGELVRMVHKLILAGMTLEKAIMHISFAYAIEPEVLARYMRDNREELH
jgi:hypothetical protein